MRTPLCCSLAILALAPLPRAAEQGYRLEEHLPAGTLALVSFPDVSATGVACSELGLSKLLREPECQRLLEPLCSALPGLMAGMGPQAMRALQDAGAALGMIRGQAALALVALDFTRQVPPVLAAAIDFGARRGDFEALLGRYRTMLEEQGLRSSQLNLSGQAVERLDLPGMPLYHAFAGSAWVLANDEATMAGLLASPGGAQAPALAASARYREVLAQVAPQGSELLVYLDIESLVRSLQEGLQGRMPGMVERLLLVILENVDALGYGMEFSGPEIVDRFHLHTSGERRGLMRLLAQPSVGHTALPLVPANAWWYSASSFDLDGLVGAGLEMAGQIDPQAGEMVAGWLARADEFFGLRLREDFLQTLGDEWSGYAAAPEGGGLIPEIALFIALKDAERFRASLGRITAAVAGVLDRQGLGLALKKHEYLGRSYLTIDVSMARQAGFPFPLRPCVLIDSNRLVLTLVPHAMKAIIERLHEGGARPSLATRPDFASRLASAPQGHVAFEYFDLGGALVWLYNAAAPIAQALLHSDLLAQLPFELDLADLPSARTLARHLGPAVAWSACDERGFTATWRSPCGSLPLILLTTAGMGSFVFLSSAEVARPPLPPGPIRAAESREEAVEEIGRPPRKRKGGGGPDQPSAPGGRRRRLM